jgi:hypothetical protein
MGTGFFMLDAVAGITHGLDCALASRLDKRRITDEMITVISRISSFLYGLIINYLFYLRV